MTYIFLILGFIILIKGADYLIDSASKIATLLGVSPFIIGISIVAFGTSAPEAAVGVLSSLRDSNEIILGTIIGSSIANIALVIGTISIILPTKITKDITRKELPISFVVQFILALMIIYNLELSRIDGAILITLFLVFLFYISRASSRKISNQQDEIHCNKKLSKSEFIKSLILFLIGITGLFIGGEIVVDNSIAIATKLGVSQTVIGLSIVALGTSLPELATSLLAIKKKESNIAIGNIIGSNIFNILLVLGLSSILLPIEILKENFIDLTIMIITTLFFLTLAYTRGRISRIVGFIMLISYFSFMLYKLI